MQRRIHEGTIKGDEITLTTNGDGWRRPSKFRTRSSGKPSRPGLKQGIPLRALASEALAEKLRVRGRPDKPWLKTFGKLSSPHKETANVSQIIEGEFGRIEPEDWQ
jgi:hypothetical protein